MTGVRRGRRRPAPVAVRRSDAYESSADRPSAPQWGPALLAADEATVLGLQRVVGNSATSRIVARAGLLGSAGVQRRGLPKASKVRNVAGIDWNLNALADDLERYQTAQASRKTRWPDQERLAFLRSMTRWLYSWYNSQKTADLASLDSEQAIVVRKVEAAIDEEHARIVDRIARRGDKITSSDPHADLVSWQGEAGVDVDAVWRHLVEGTGALRIEGSAVFIRSARSMLVRILATPLGARLLTRLSLADETRTVTIGEGDPSPHLKRLLFEPSAGESKAIPQVFEHGDDADADRRDQLRTLTEMVPVDPATVDVQQYPLFREPVDLLRAAMDRRPGICLRHAPGVVQCLRFAAGAYGAYVALIDSPGGVDNRGVSANRSVHTPLFVTLAHELGHALNQLAGTATLEAESIFALFAGDVGTFPAPGPERQRWSNAEEFLIIEGLENEIRRAVGLASRGGHAGVVIPELNQRLMDGRKLVETLCGAVYTTDQSAWAMGIVNDLLKLKKETVKGLSISEKRLMIDRYESEMIRASKLLSKDRKIAAAVLKLLREQDGVAALFERHVPDVLSLLA